MENKVLRADTDVYGIVVQAAGNMQRRLGRRVPMSEALRAIVMGTECICDTEFYGHSPFCRKYREAS